MDFQAMQDEVELDGAWSFVEKYYRNYFTCNDIARADELEKIVNDEVEFDGDIIEAINEYNKLHLDLYIRAIEDYIELVNDNSITPNNL